MLPWFGLGAGCARLAVVLDEFFESGPGVVIWLNSLIMTKQCSELRQLKIEEHLIQTRQLHLMLLPNLSESKGTALLP